MSEGPRRFPIQDGDSIPWEVAAVAYVEYARRFGRSQTLEVLARRGGFGVKEMDTLYPDWRADCARRDNT